MATIECLSDILAATAAKFPHKAAYVDGGLTVAYADLAEAAARIAGGLASKLGVRTGDRVAVAAANCGEYVTAYWGLQWGGMVPVPVNIRLPREAARHVVAHTGAAAVLLQEGIPAEARDGVADAGLPVIPFDSRDWDELLNAEPAERRRPEPGSLAIIMHTSGTTGLPKGAMMTHETSLFNIRMAVLSWSWRHEDTHLLAIPLFHCTAAYSAMPSSVYLGSTLVIAPRPDVPQLLDLIEKYRVTTFLGVPSLFHLFVSHRETRERDLSSLRMLGYSGSPMPRQTIERLRARLPGVALHNFFGLTETTSNTHVTADEDADLRPDTIGKPLPEVFQLVVAEDDRPVGPGETGELCIAQENVIPGYWGEPELLASSIRDGWFHTGDLAMVDAEGYTYIRGRKKDMIIVAGENVYAPEVEQVLLQHGAILEAAVVGLPATGAAAYMGEVIKAVIVAEPGSGLTASEVRRFCIERLASYQVPQVIEFRHELPRTPSGKVIKRVLVEPAADGDAGAGG